MLREVDGLEGTGRDAQVASAIGEMQAVRFVDDRRRRDRAGEEGVDGLVRAEAEVEDAGHVHGADVEAGLAADTVVADVASALPDVDGEVAVEAANGGDVRAGDDLDVVVLVELGQPGRQQAGRALHRGRDLLGTDHGPTDGDVTLDEPDLPSGLRARERGFDAGQAPTDDEEVGERLHRSTLERLGVARSLQGRVDERLGLLGCLGAVLRHPGAVLADVGELHVRHVDAHLLGEVTECALVLLG